ncbi:helix-turn-helix domain-containing protein [Kitasatospora sp. NPDC048239]|uniref:helix-turn-helix domain-containing protein n=1 Tax=Kitasatospora sp. NPDC048239 TaxID=3364046 RepID=UPI00371CBC55
MPTTPSHAPAPGTPAVPPADLLADRALGLRQISEAQSALASAAARPDALRAVLHQLAVHLGAWTVLLDARGGELFSAGPRPAEPVLAELRALAARTTGRARTTGGRTRPPGAAAQHHAGGHLTLRTLPGSDGGGGPLTLATAATEPPTAVHRSVAGVAVVLLSLLTSPRHVLGADARSAGALVRLLLGADPAEVAPTLLPDDAPSEGHWVVVHGRLTGTVRPGGDAVQLAALGTALGTPYLDVDGARLRALIPGRPPVDPAADPEPAARLGWTLGYSAPAPGAALRTADLQAERALRRALATGEPVVRHREAGERSVHALVAPEDAADLARVRFAPLAAAGAPGPEVLLETLRTWLSLHGSWDRTAAALQLHRNTVRQRVARVGELLGVDLQEAELRMELWFALRWLPADPDGAG